MGQLTFPGQTTNGSFLSNRIGLPNTVTSAMDADERLKQQATDASRIVFDSVYDERGNDNAFTRLGKYVGVGALDTVDTIASVLPGIDRGQTLQAAQDMGMDGVTDFAERNKTGVELTSGVLTSFAGGWMAERYLIGALGSRLLASSALSNIGIVRAGSQLMPRARAIAMATQEAAADAGTTSSLLAPGMRQLITASMGKNLGKAAVTESTILAIGHNNDTIWSDDMSSNLFWFGLGLAVPTGAGALQARAEIRSMANDASILQRRIEAMDPNQIQRMRGVTADPTLPRDPYAERSYSAEVTQFALEAKQNIDVGNPEKTLWAKRSAQTIQAEGELKEAVGRLLSQKMEGTTGKKISIAESGNNKDFPLAKQVMDALNEDPFAMMEVQSVATGDIAGIKKSRDNAINKFLSSNIPEDVAQGRRLQKETPYVMINGRWHLASKEAEEFASFDPTKTVFKQEGAPFQWRLTTQDGHTQLMDPTGNVKGEFNKKSVRDRFAIVQALKKISANIRSAPVKMRPSFAILDKSPWIQKEYAAYHMAQGGQVELGKSSFKSAPEIKFSALKDKIAAMKSDGIWGTYLDNWTRRKYNLPTATQLERIEDGTSKALYTVLSQIDVGKIKDWDSANQLYNQLLTRSDLASKVRTKPTTMDGDMWTFGFGKNDEFYRPILAYHKPRTTDPMKRGTRAQQAEEMAQNRQIVFWEMNSGNQTDVVGQTNAFIHTTPEGQNLFSVGQLADDQITGTGTGFKAELGALLQTMFRGRDSKTIQAAVRAGQQVDDIAMAVTRADLESLNGSAQRLSSSANMPSRHLYNEFSSLRVGWDLKAGGAVKDPVDGMWKFQLDEKSAWNAERLGRDVQPGEYLARYDSNNGYVKDLVLDDTGMDFLNGLTNIFERKRLEENKIRRAMGLPEIRHTPYFLPSESSKGKFIGFTISAATRRPIPGRAVVASTADEFRRLRQEAEANLKPGEYFHSQREISHTQDLFDQAQLYWVDAHFVGRPNASATGALVGGKIRQNTIEEHLRYLQEKNVSLAGATVRNALHDQIRIAKMRREVDRDVYGAATDSDAKVKEVGAHTIWDDYLKVIAGPASAGVNDRRITTYLKAAEDYMQPIVNAVWKGKNLIPTEQAFNLVQDMFTRFGVNVPSKAKDFATLSAKLGPHSPYATLSEFMKQTTQAVRPPTVQELASQMNRFDASIRLRYLEIPNAAMNLLGIINNMPSILANSKTPMIGQLVSGSGKSIGVVDGMKILMNGTRRAMKKVRDVDMEYAARMGGLEPGVAEIRKTMAGIEDLGTWARAFKGDGTIKNATPFTPDWFRAKGVDGFLGVLNDTTESWSRHWAHAIGLEVADLQGITGVKERFNFANSLADQAIANYSPLNRGEAYQTALGSMMGLYQTYAMTYTGRMFRYLETGEYKALMRQLAVQSMMFGTKSNIAWSQFEWLESQFDGRDEESTISDLIYAKFGPQVGSLIAHGGVADIATLFGADTGIALYQRADSNIRTNLLPGSDGGFDPFKMAAALSTAKQVTQGIWEVGKGLVTTDDLGSMRNVSEVLATHMPNRFMRGLLTVAANDGMDIDNYGQVVTDSKGIFESTVRILGLRTTRQQDEVDFKYANRASLDKQAAQMEQLRQETRAIFRSGDSTRLPEIFEAYVERGGNPTMFKSWVRQNLEAATTTRSLRELQRGLNSDKMRLMLARHGWTQ